MVQNNFYNFSALAIIAVLFLSELLSHRLINRAGRVFSLLKIWVLVSTAADILVVSMSANLPQKSGSVMFFSAVYQFFHVLTGLLFLAYVISMTDTWHKVRKNYALLGVLAVPTLAFLVFLVLSLGGSGYLFTVDPSLGAVPGKLAFISYAVGALYYIVALFYILKYRKLFDKVGFAALLGVFPIQIASGLLEVIAPQLHMSMLFDALTIIFISLALQRPEELQVSFTGFGNARTYENICRKIFANEKHVAEIYVDIKNFRHIHEAYSYKEETAFILDAASAIRNVNKGTRLFADVCYTNGGHFHLIVEPSRFANIEKAAALLARSLNKTFTYNGLSMTAQVSVFVARIPQDVNSYEDLMNLSSTSMSAAKAGTVLYAEELFRNDHWRKVLNIDRIVENAIRDHRFEFHYQPIYSLKEERYVSAEALIRMKDPDYGYVSPGLFIPAAERSGAINRIWDVVLEDTCRFMNTNEFKGLGLHFLQVNLSVVQCIQDNLYDQVMSKLEKYRINPTNYCFEITETAVADSDSLTRNIKSLNAAGIRFSVDDYGSGYSDIRRVADLPISVVKLDRALISSEEPRMVCILEDTIRMIHRLGMKAVAEGVETQFQVDLLRRMDCDFAQGFIFSPSLPENEFCSFIKRKNGRLDN